MFHCHCADPAWRTYKRKRLLPALYGYLSEFFAIEQRPVHLLFCPNFFFFFF